MGIGAALLISTIATGASVIQQEQARKQAKKESRRAAARQSSILGELEERERQGELSAARIAQRRRQRAQAAGAITQGRRGTILTGPLGIPGTTEGGEKTLLGL